MNFIYDAADNAEYECINITITDGNIMNMSLMTNEGNYVAIDDDYFTCHGYYNIRFSSSPYTLQLDLNIDGQVTSSGEIVCEGTYYFPININSHYYVYTKIYQIT